MLSRVADSIYWMSRYIERAENVARFVDVNLNLLLDGSDPNEQQWMPLVSTTGDHKLFAQRFGEPTQQNVIKFLTFDRENPNSILSCVRFARENARSVREIISSEMWLQINKFYLMVNEAANRDGGYESADEFFSQIKLNCHLFAGIADATMNRGEAWHFVRLGKMIERADKTSRILDVKYFILLRSLSDVGTPYDEIQWAAVLRSASAFEMYRKRHGRIAPKAIVEFLLLDPDFPRSVRFCLETAKDSLCCITKDQIKKGIKLPNELLNRLCENLTKANVNDIIASGLHEYLDDLQTNLNQLGDGIRETFFSRRLDEIPALKKEQTQTQTQIQ